ncbi:MAG: serine hydrolase [Dehalococcoidales bacterium]|nr:serine hydrolase [Dehalococcoidales bacterium]
MNNISVEKISKLGEIISNKYIPNILPNFSILVQQNNEDIYYFQTGMIDIKRKRPINRNSIFRIYSMTKPITSLSIMILLEQGKLKITDDVEKYIPEWNNLRVYKSGDFNDLLTEPPKRKMKIKDLLMHRSGLTYNFEDSSFVHKIYLKESIEIARAKEKLTPDEYIKRLSDIPLVFSPGEYFNYSISTDILGFIIERIAKKDLESFFKENIFDPLQMKDTFFTVPNDKIDRLSNCYIFDEKSNNYTLEDDHINSSYIDIPKSYSGGGGLLSTIDDYMKFCNLLQNKGSIGEENLIGSKTSEFMMSNHLEGNLDLPDIAKGGKWGTRFYNGIGFSLGGSVVLDPIKNMSLRSKGEFSWGGAASTQFWVDQTEKISVVFMSQMLGKSYSSDLRADISQLVYQSIV